jgi:hypothetical protein
MLGCRRGCVPAGTRFERAEQRLKASAKRFAASLLIGLAGLSQARGEAMLQYFNTSWKEITEKMPELAEAGYSSLWLPPPQKGSGGLSVGYDHWDPFDLGSKDQRGSVRTRYGTEAELLELVETAHRFGIRVYFDNVMNHRAFDIPGYNADTPIDIYPGMVPEDFHLRLTEDGFYRKWDNIANWGDAWQVMNRNFSDLIDIAQEPGDVNLNFGTTEGSTFKKIKFLRHPNNPEFYCFLPNGTYVGFGPTNGITAQMLQDNKSFYSERVEDYLNRAARWLIDRTKADGLRLDAVKHVRADFFGASGAGKDESDYGYSGQVQRQFNLTRGFSDSNHRDALFDTEKPRDDAILFGEHLGEPPAYFDYFDRGQRLVDNILRDTLNGRLGNPSSGLQGLDQPGGGGFAAQLGVAHAQSHDNDYAARRELQHAIYFTRAGLGLLYTDGNHHSETLGESGGAFPRHANTAFLGQWGDNRIPNLLYIHDQFARGYQKPIWADADYLAYERIDKRENGGMSDADGVTMLFMLNDNYAAGQARDIRNNISYAHTSPSPDSYLVNYSSSGGEFYKYASDLHTVVVPPGGYFVFGWRNPRESDLWKPGGGKPVTILQNGQEVGTMTYTRRDGPDGDPGFNPYGLPDANPADYAYDMTIPRVTVGTNLSFVVRTDGSAENILLKLDGGVDLNGTRPPFTNVGLPNQDPGFRDNPPALSWDMFLGYEQPNFQQRIFPEMFAAANTARNVTGSAGAETYTTAGVLNQGNGTKFADGDTVQFIYHDPTALVGGTNSPPNQYEAGNNRIWAKTNGGLSGFRVFLYYTGNTAFPEGAGGQGIGTTKVVELFFQHDEGGGSPGSWWRSNTLPGDFNSSSRYKIGAFKTSAPSWFPSGEAEVNKIKKMLTTFQITGFNASNIVHYPHTDYGATATGLKEGFHVVRGRAFLSRSGRASIYNTFTQTFYYDTKRPEGEIKFPATNGETIGGSQYGVVVRTDPTVTEVWYHIDDSDAANNDAATGAQNGNGNGSEPFTDSNNNGVRDPNEPFVDINGNGTYDSNLSETWARASEVTPSLFIASPYRKEWRFNYVNVPFGGAAATIKVRLREASSSKNLTLSDTAGHFTTLQRNVFTSGPTVRMFVAFPPSDGTVVGNDYVMKVYFTKSLADGLSTPDLINRFLISIASSESGSTNNAIAQDRANYSINFNATADYHELAFPLPNLYNDVSDFLHGILVTHTRPGQPTLLATRFVKAFPSPAAPFIAIIKPVNVDSDGQPFQIVLPNVPSPTPDQRRYDVRVQTGVAGTNVNIVINSAPVTYTNLNNGMLSVTNFVDGSSRFWDFNWINLVPGQYTFTATVTTTNNATASASRTTTVVFRELVAENPNDADDDDDGLTDLNETTVTPLPSGYDPTDPRYNPNSDTWSNGDVHIHYAYGHSNPLSPDSDGDGLPDGLEVGWRTPITNDTNVATDTNGDGWPNFIADLDPPFYNTLDNFGRVPGVNSAAEGGDRSRQVAGTVTDPFNPDTDGDGLPDGIEDANRNGWVDGDGASIGPTDQPSLARNWPNNKIDPGEVWRETSPTKADSDGDGLSDGFGEDKNINGRVDIGLINCAAVPCSGTVTGMVANVPTIGGPFSRAIDRTALAAQYPNAVWLETDPLDPDTDRDGLPDGWEVQYGLDPLDNGTVNMRTGGAGNPANGASGDPDGDGFTNIQELANGTNPKVPDTGVPPPPGTIVIGPRTNVIVRGGVTNAMEFTDWSIDDLIVLDEFDGNGFNNQGTDVYHAYDGFDSSRDIVAFYARDGGAIAQGGDGKFYFRVDLHDLKAFAEDGYLDLYVVIDTGNPASGESALPDQVDTRTDMKWEAVVAVYSGNNGRVYIDTDHGNNTTVINQNLSATGVIVRDQNTANGFLQAYFNSELDAVEFSISRQALLDAGWNGLDAAQLNYQVFTTKDGTLNSPQGPGDIGGRSDIRDTIYDDFIASDYWKDQTAIAGVNSVLKAWFGKNASNDRGKRAKVISLIYGNQAIQPGSVMQAKINNDAAAGYYRPLDAHDAYSVPLSLQITPATAAAIQWAKADPPQNKPWRDGPAFNQRIASLTASNVVGLLGTTFAGHILTPFPDEFNVDNVDLAEQFLQNIYGTLPSQNCFLPPERVADSTTLTKITSVLGYQYGFVDQFRHIFKWFGRSSALGNDGYRINQINGAKTFVINDQASTYRFQNNDRGLNMPLRQLLHRKAQSATQDQVVILFSDWDDFLTKASADAYDLNIRWIASHPWIQIVTPDMIANGQVDITGDGTGDAWGVVNRGTGLSLPKVAKDFVDYATLENYDNWYNGLSGQREGLRDKIFDIRTGVPMPTAFGQVGVSGVSSQAWARVKAMNAGQFNGPLGMLARGAIHAAMFVTAFHNQSPVDLTKYSTGDYVNPATAFQSLAGFSKIAQSQARFAAMYNKVSAWTVAPPAAATTEQFDVDLDGQVEYLLYNDRVFAVFDAIGGRLVAAFARDTITGAVYQFVGNQLSYAGTETEEEGATNLTAGNVNAHRTSGLKDWFAQTGGAGVGTTRYVTNVYAAAAAPSGTGWRFTSSDGAITKTIRLSSGDNKFEVSYGLAAGVNKLFVRNGLSPDLLTLLFNGQTTLTGPTNVAGKVFMRNFSTYSDSSVSLNASDVAGHSNTTWNAAAIDGTNAFTTINMRNQAQTHQIELESAATAFSFALEMNALERGPTVDHVGDGVPDAWRALYFPDVDPTGLTTNSVSCAACDPDGDGMNNFGEFTAGTHPRDSNSALRIISVTHQAGVGTTVSWTTVPGKKYQLMGTTTVENPASYTNIGGVITAAGSSASQLDSAASDSRKYYKVKVVP